MSQGKATRRAIVRSPRGLHLRPWGQFAELAAQFDAKIEVINGSTRADGKSAMHLMMLAAVEGTELTVEAEGAAAAEAADALAAFVENFIEEIEATEREQTR